MSLLAMCISGGESSLTAPQIPLVQRVDNYPGTPPGYVAYEVRGNPAAGANSRQDVVDCQRGNKTQTERTESVVHLHAFVGRGTE